MLLLMNLHFDVKKITKLGKRKQKTPSSSFSLEHYRVVCFIRLCCYCFY